MNRQTYIETRRVLADWASPQAAGRARSAWLTSVAAISTENPVHPAFTVDFGRATYTIDVSGNRLEEAAVETMDQIVKLPVGAHIDTGIPIGSAPTNKMVGGLRIPCGATFFVAGGDAGKTPAVHAFAGANDEDYEVVRYGEPLAGYLSDERQGAMALAIAMYRSKNVVVDSIKDLLALASGGAMKSGLSRGALPMISRWGALAASLGCTLYVPVNPSSDDIEVFNLLVEATKSNATSLLYATGDSWKYINRRGEGLIRESGMIQTHYIDDGVMSIGSSTADDKFDVSSLTVEAVKLSSNDFTAAIRRAVQ